jgi:cell division protein FtsB
MDDVFSAKSFWLPVLLMTLMAAFFGALLARGGRVLDSMLERQARLDAKLLQLEAEVRLARAQRDALMSSPEAIEQVARVDYGFVAPGEQVREFASAPVRSTLVLPPEVKVSGWQKMLTWRFLPLALPAATFLLAGVTIALANAVALARRTHAS